MRLCEKLPQEFFFFFKTDAFYGYLNSFRRTKPNDAVIQISWVGLADTPPPDTMGEDGCQVLCRLIGLPHRRMGLPLLLLLLLCLLLLLILLLLLLLVLLLLLFLLLLLILLLLLLLLLLLQLLLLLLLLLILFLLYPPSDADLLHSQGGPCDCLAP